MKIRKAERKQSKIRIGIAGPAGSGKTYSSLLLAQGLIGSFENITVIDTESGSADLYAHLGPYNVITIDPPYTPEKYIEAITLAYDNQSQCIIIDSLSHSWEYLIDYHSKLDGNSYTNWSVVTPRHRKLVQAILDAPCHIIATLRTKTDYVLNENSKGKLVPSKVGMKSIQRDGIDYEFTIYFELNINHLAQCTKDRTGMFESDILFQLDQSIGEKIMGWCMDGTSIEDVIHQIDQCESIDELKEIFSKYRSFYGHLKDKFTERKLLILNSPNIKSFSSNGIEEH